MNETLLSEFWRLSKMSMIQDLERYAQDWYILGAAFDKALCPAMASACYGRWKQYMPQAEKANGVYVRIFEPPFATLAKV